MVLVVVAHIEGKQVEGAIVWVGLMALEEHVVLSYEVTRNGMQAHPQHRASQHVEDRLAPPQPVEQDVKTELENHIGHLQLSDRFRVDAQWPDGIEQWLQDNPDKLAEARAEKPAFKLSGNVYIHTVSSQVAVMIQVITFKGGRVGQAYRQIGKHGKIAIPQGLVVAKGSVVGDLMNCKGHWVVDTAAKDISPKQDPFPAQIFDQVKS